MKNASFLGALISTLKLYLYIVWKARNGEFSSGSECGRMMVLSESVEDNEEVQGDDWLVNGTPVDPEVLKTFCIGEGGLASTLRIGDRVKVTK